MKCVNILTKQNKDDHFDKKQNLVSLTISIKLRFPREGKIKTEWILGQVVGFVVGLEVGAEVGVVLGMVLGCVLGSVVG